MRRLVFVVVVLIAFGATLAVGQESSAVQNSRFAVFGGYQFLSVNVSGVRTNVPQGWDADLAVRTSRNISVVADFSGSYQDRAHLHNVLFGPRYSVSHGKVTPFAEGLFGFGRFSDSGISNNGFGMALGGGLDVSASRRVAVRLAKVNWLLDRNSGVNANDLRIATGLVFKF